MSQFISLRILASLTLGRSKKTSKRGTPGAPPVVENRSDAPREETSSVSRISVNRIQIEN